MRSNSKHRGKALWAILVLLFTGPTARADVITDWNITAGELAVAAKLPPPPTYRVMAIVQSAVYEAVISVTGHQAAEEASLSASQGASLAAAVAAANRVTLQQLVPSQQAAIASAYEAALAALPDGAAKSAGIALGEQAALSTLDRQSHDGAAVSECYRPSTTAGVYVPTAIPAVPQWPQRKPWFLASPDQFRPEPPPSLSSDLWARDYEEVRALGAKNSTQRTPEQTEIARFWEATMPPIYFAVVRSVADLPGRETAQNARLFAVAAQAMDDALIAVMDAKYHYNFWRPVTAIRNGDEDGNGATARDSSWTPFIDTPLHPEYPCAHCILSGAVGEVLDAEVGDGTLPTLSSTSPTAGGATRSWATIDGFVQEVANARIYDGVHFRHSTEVGTAMGKAIGGLAADQYLRPIH